MTFMISILDRRQQPSTRVSFVFWPHPFFSLGLACHFPRLVPVPRWGSSTSHPWLSEVLFWQVIFFLLYFTSSLLFKIFLLMTPLSVSCLCLIYALVFLSCQALCCLPFLFSPLFVGSCLFSHFCPFSYVFFCLPPPPSFSVLIPCLAVCFLTSQFSPLPYSTFLFTFFLHTVPLVTVVLHPYLYIYMCVYICLHSTSSILQLKQRNDTCW